MPNKAMRPIRVLHLVLALVVGFAPATILAQDHVAGSATFIQRLAENAAISLSDESLGPAEREGGFRRLFTDNFAVGSIARFSLGRYWRGASSAQRKEYLALFEDVIITTWASQFSQFDGQRVEVSQAIDAKSPRADENAALVRSAIHVNNSTAIRVDWHVANKGDIYKITDILVEGISMVTTQRDEFVSVVRANGGTINDLLSMLREQRDTARAEAAALN